MAQYNIGACECCGVTLACSGRIKQNWNVPLSGCSLNALDGKRTATFPSHACDHQLSPTWGAWIEPAIFSLLNTNISVSLNASCLGDNNLLEECVGAGFTGWQARSRAILVFGIPYTVGPDDFIDVNLEVRFSTVDSMFSPNVTRNTGAIYDVTIPYNGTPITSSVTLSFTSSISGLGYTGTTVNFTGGSSTVTFPSTITVT